MGRKFFPTIKKYLGYDISSVSELADLNISKNAENNLSKNATTIISIREVEVRTLLQKIAVGDAKAFEVLHRKYGKMVLNYIRISGLTKSYLSKDISQDVFEKLWNSRERIHLVDSFENYLFRVVRNHLLNEHAKTNVRRKTLQEFHQNNRKAIIMEDEVLFRDSSKLFSQKLEQLPPRQKEVSDLYFNWGLNIIAIAKKTGLSASSVKTHLNRAKKRLIPS